MPGHTPMDRKKAGVPPLPAMPEPKMLSKTEFRELVEHRIRRHFDMSLAAFAKAFRSGQFGDDLVALDLAVLSGVTTSS